MDQVTRQWTAPPTRVFDADGATFHQWAFDHGAIIPSFAFASGGSASGIAFAAPLTCIITFETVSGSKDIIAGGWEGNNCCVATVGGWCANLPRQSR